MAEKSKKPKISFKELPVYLKVLRIVFLVLFIIGMTFEIVAMILSIDNPYNWPLHIPALSILFPALAVAIVNFVLEKKYREKLEAKKAAQPAEENKETEAKPVSTNNEVWFCPECGTKNEGAFCSNCGSKKPVVEQKKEVSASKEETPKQEVKSNNTLQKVLHIVIPCAGFGIIAVWLLIGGLLAYISTLVNFFENLSPDNSGYYYWGSANALVGATIIGAMGLVAALIVIIHIVKKFDAMKTMKAYVLVPVAGLAFMFLFCLSETIYLAVLSADVGVKFDYGKLIAVMVLGVIAIVLAFISMGFSKKNPLTFRIMIAATMLMSAIPMFILGSMFGEGSTLWAVGPALIATGILLMLISAGCFFIKPKQ